MFSMVSRDEDNPMPGGLSRDTDSQLLQDSDPYGRVTKGVPGSWVMS
jgi:hypothetical protein